MSILFPAYFRRSKLDAHAEKNRSRKLEDEQVVA